MKSNAQATAIDLKNTVSGGKFSGRDSFGCFRRRAAGLFVALAMLLAFAVTVAAMPSRTDTLVVDEAGVLTDATVEHITQTNAILFAMTGAEVAVVIVQNTGFESIETYAHTLFNDWRLGCAQLNNGVLLLVSVSRGEYYALQGDGIRDVFSSGKLQSFLNDYMSVSFNAGDTDTGVLKTFDAIVAHFEGIYGISLDDYNGTASYSISDIGGSATESGATSDTKSLTETVFFIVRTAFFIIIGLIAAIAAFFIIRSLIMAHQEREYKQRHPARDVPMNTTRDIPRPVQYRADNSQPPQNPQHRQNPNGQPQNQQHRQNPNGQPPQNPQYRQNPNSHPQNQQYRQNPNGQPQNPQHRQNPPQNRSGDSKRSNS